MFAKVSAFLALATVALAASVAREDATIEVNIPKGQSLTAFCKCWSKECVDLAHREGKPYDVCGAGYAGPGTARVDCLAVTSSTTDIKFTQEVVAALKLTYPA